MRDEVCSSHDTDMKLKPGDKSCGLNAHIVGIYGGATARRRRASGAPHLGKFVTHRSDGSHVTVRTYVRPNANCRFSCDVIIFQNKKLPIPLKFKFQQT